MSTHKILLVNKSIGIGVQSVVVSGHSRKVYGHSNYDQKFCGHIFEMTPEAYAKAADDLARNWHKSRCKWVPRFVTSEGASETLVTPMMNEDLRALYQKSAAMLASADLIAILADRGISVRSSIPEPEIVEQAIVPHGTSVELPTKWWPLVKIAKDEGMNIDGIKGIKPMQEAIREHRRRLMAA